MVFQHAEKCATGSTEPYWSRYAGTECVCGRVMEALALALSDGLHPRSPAPGQLDAALRVADAEKSI